MLNNSSYVNYLVYSRFNRYLVNVRDWVSVFQISRTFYSTLTQKSSISSEFPSIFNLIWIRSFLVTTAVGHEKNIHALHCSRFSVKVLEISFSCDFLLALSSTRMEFWQLPYAEFSFERLVYSKNRRENLGLIEKFLNIYIIAGDQRQTLSRNKHVVCHHIGQHKYCCFHIKLFLFKSPMLDFTETRVRIFRYIYFLSKLKISENVECVYKFISFSLK